jgi:hypothetical protein
MRTFNAARRSALVERINWNGIVVVSLSRERE